MTDPAEFGARMLTNLAEGRRRNAAERAKRSRDLVEWVQRAERLERAEGHPARGMPKRIVNRLQRMGYDGHVSERHVLNILSELSSSGSDSLQYNASRSSGGKAQ
jgi:hypothetical protein